MGEFSVYEILTHAGENAPKEYTFYLQGDLQGMAYQKEVLVYNGYDVKHSDVYPVLQEKDKKSALTLFWRGKVDCWWLYKDKLIQLGICTEDEFKEAVKKQPDGDNIKKTLEVIKEAKEKNINTIPKIDRKLRL